MDVPEPPASVEIRTTDSDTFRGVRVRAHTDEHTYEGWCGRWHYDEYGVIIYDAERDDGAEVGPLAPYLEGKLAATRSEALRAGYHGLHERHTLSSWKHGRNRPHGHRASLPAVLCHQRPDHEIWSLRRKPSNAPPKTTATMTM
jgi:hypothetical protein